jgi:hypothetical protein
VGADPDRGAPAGIEAELLDVRNGGEVGRAIEAAVSKGIDALLVGNDGVTQENRFQIVDLAARKAPKNSRPVD